MCSRTNKILKRAYSTARHAPEVESDGEGDGEGAGAGEREGESKSEGEGEGEGKHASRARTKANPGSGWGFGPSGLAERVETGGEATRSVHCSNAPGRALGCG